MTAPPTTQLAADAYARLEPVWAHDDQRGWPLLAFLGGLGEAFRDGEEIARAQPGREPYQQAFDIDRCPTRLLPFLGQFVGVPVNATASDLEQRTQIRAEGGFARGRPLTMLSAVQATLTGSKRARLTERSADAWTILITTDPADTPDTAQTNRAAQAVKPAGDLLTVTQASVPLIDEFVRPIDSITATIDTLAITDVN